MTGETLLALAVAMFQPAVLAGAVFVACFNVMLVTMIGYRAITNLTGKEV